MGPRGVQDPRRRGPALLLALLALALPATARPSAAAPGSELSEAQLLEIARRAPPAPEPPLDGGVHLDDETAHHAAAALTAYGRALGVSAPLDPPAGEPVWWPIAAAGLAPADIAATRPVAVYDTMQPPWNAVAKLLVRFIVDGKPHFYACSGALVGPFHLLTAAHCVFSFDPNGDGSLDDAAWADDVWVWPAQTDLLEPLGVPERPFGESRAVLNRAYEGWTVAHDITWDIALLTLNRPAAGAAGWMDLEADHPVAGLSFSGYPVEEPYVPPETLVQYGGSGAADVAGYGDRQVQLTIFSYGGHSGGPVWRDDPGGNAKLQGVLSVSDRRGYAAATLVTAANSADFATWMSDDYERRMPVSRPDLCEYMLAPAAKGLLARSARQRDAVGVTFNVFNSGAADSGRIAVDFYLSTNPSIGAKDVFVDRRTLDSLLAGAFLVATTDLTIPSTAPAGEYYLGWLMRASEAEYSTTNNAVVIGDQLLRVERALTPTRTPTDTRTPTPTETLAPTETSTASPLPTETATVKSLCLGDCGGDRRVTVDELVLMVTIGLGAVSVDDCPNGDADGDGLVGISEVIVSVRHALDGCAR